MCKATLDTHKNMKNFLQLMYLRRQTIKPGMSFSYSNTPSDILSSWIALEVLSPQTFRKPQDLAGSFGSIAYLNDGLPWEREGEPSRPKYRLYYQIVLGTLDFGRSINKLLDVYADKRVERPAPQGEAIVAVVVVDNKGYLVEDPAVTVSSFAWGLQYAIEGNLKKLSEWVDAEHSLQMAIDKILRRTDKEGKKLPLDENTIKLATSQLLKELHLSQEFITGNSFAVRTYEYITNPEAPAPPLLNSFFINDLIAAGRLFTEGKATPNLKRFLGSPSIHKDILRDQQVLEGALAPSMMSPGRWPGPGRHPLVVLQQAAVNLALHALTTEGILAVNGPPGTGKTTLLRDIVAGLIIQRAEVMCTYRDPNHAFKNSGEKIQAGQAWLHLYELDSRLKGFEILIASSNNKAVENISAELPGINAIADDAKDLRYFSSLSDGLLERESWGLIAAVLGNAANRSRFRQLFWWDKEIGLSTYLAEAAGTPQFVEATRKPKIVEKEDAPAGPAEALERWVVAKDNFISTVAKSRTALSKLEEARQFILNFSSLQEALDKAQTALEKAENTFRNAKDRTSRLKKKPGFLAFLFGMTSARTWKQSYKDLEQAEKEQDQAKAIRERAFQAVQKATTEISRAKMELGDHIIDPDFFKLRHERKHLVSPWCDATMQRLRDDVFVSAMKLHKAFIDAAARPLKHNIGALMNVFSGRPFADERKQALLADVWASLFIVVPSVSTTFASMERMLGSLPPQSLGWLLIDEAGQALPQAAVGALMRTNRAVVVGDPLQIEPVVTLPDTLTKNICRQFNIDPDRYNAPDASAQTLADTATAYFAEFEGKYGSRSVGVPLLVHRRCDEPMFSVSNNIAYERLMVQAKRPGSSPIRDCLGPSAWIDVQGRAQEKWSPEEGAIVLDLLQRLRNKKVAPDLYIITPFVIVADNLRRLIRDSGILEGWVDDTFKWPNERIGTVHTVQGRETEAVIFVLGAPLPSQTGARGWAGGRPNLLNVAVTRAKEVLYVIGNRQLWQGAGLFSELSGKLS